MTPDELYELFSKNPCTSSVNPGRNIDPVSGNGDVFGTPGFDQGMGAAYWLARIVDMSSFLKYSCIEEVTDTLAYIHNDYKYQLCLPFKFLRQLDAGAYEESQSVPQCGVAHSLRNAVDTMKACHYVAKGDYTQPFTRTATEYMSYWGYTSIPDNLLMLGPDILKQDDALDKGPTLNGMTCFPGSQGVPGSPHGCQACPGEERASCKGCACCDPANPDDICCKPGSIDYIEQCCGYNRLTYDHFSYFVPSQDGSFGGDILTGRLGERIYHIGIIERKDYQGIVNLRTNAADRLKSVDYGLFFEYFQKRNGWRYGEYPYSDDGDMEPIGDGEGFIKRCRVAMPIMLPASVSSKGGMPQTDTQFGLKLIKQMLFNGEGLALFSNVGFPNVRDSTGLVYPDRIWYQMYSIIGYDDRCIEFDECVYVLHCPFGDWISGGHPSWGPLPPGAFLVTETVMEQMIKYMNGNDYFECRATECPGFDFVTGNAIDCNAPENIEKYSGCSSVPKYPNCNPYFCAPRQSAFGMLFALSLNEKLTQNNEGDRLLNYQQFIPAWSTSELVKQATAYSCTSQIPQEGNNDSDDDRRTHRIVWGRNGNQYREREQINKLATHAPEHQDMVIMECAILPACTNRSDDEQPVLYWKLKVEDYFGFVKIEQGPPPEKQEWTVYGDGAFV